MSAVLAPWLVLVCVCLDVCLPSFPPLFPPVRAFLLCEKRFGGNYFENFSSEVNIQVLFFGEWNFDLTAFKL